MNNLNPLFEMNARLMKKAIKTASPYTMMGKGQLNMRQTNKAAQRFFGPGMTDNGQVKGRLGDMYNRAIGTRKGQAIAAKLNGQLPPPPAEIPLA